MNDANKSLKNNKIQTMTKTLINLFWKIIKISSFLKHPINLINETNYEIISKITQFIWFINISNIMKWKIIFLRQSSLSHLLKETNTKQWNKQKLKIYHHSNVLQNQNYSYLVFYKLNKSLFEFWITLNFFFHKTINKNLRE